VNYLIASLLLLFTCVSGFADQVNQPKAKTKNPPPKNRPTETTTIPEDELGNAPAEK